jgi:hypothetical protein
LQYGQGLSIDYWKGSAAYNDDGIAFVTRPGGTIACAQHAASVTSVCPSLLVKYRSIDQELRLLPNVGGCAFPSPVFPLIWASFLSSPQHSFMPAMDMVDLVNIIALTVTSG